jgi:hypothetical protein
LTSSRWTALPWRFLSFSSPWPGRGASAMQGPVPYWHIETAVGVALFVWIVAASRPGASVGLPTSRRRDASPLLGAFQHQSAESSLEQRKRSGPR